MRRTFAAALALATGACGYAFSHRYVAKGGAAAVHVRAFENRSGEPELGAAVTAALRSELARRGANGTGGAAASIEGEVRASEPTPSALRPPPPQPGSTPAVATWRIGVEVRARLVADGAAVAEHVARREADYLGGEDPLEAEGRRALALRRLADEAAREILRAFER